MRRINKKSVALKILSGIYLFTLSNFTQAIGAESDNKDKKDESTWTIKNVSVEEGALGYHVRVSCIDHSQKNSSYSSYSGDYYDDEEYDNNARCGISQDELEKITFTPKVKISVAELSSRGFRIFGNFRRGEYAVNIAKGATSSNGAKLAEQLSNWKITIPARTPKVKFTSTGRYIPREHWKAIPITFVNTEKVRVTLRHIRPENLVYWLGETYNEYINERVADTVAQKDIVVHAKEDDNGTRFLDLRDLVKEPQNGVYEVKVNPVLKREQQQRRRFFWEDDEPEAETSKEYLGNGDIRRVMMTNINIIAKKQPKDDTYLVSVLNTDEGEPLRGARVKAVSSSGRIIGECKTSKSGCLLSGKTKEGVGDSVAIALIATYDDDLSYLRFSDLKLKTTNANIYGPEFGAKTPYRASLYGDRDIYRPGETIHIAAIVRDENYISPKQGMPVVFNIRDSRGRLAKTSTLKINSAGMAETSLTLNPTADTGKYRADLLVAGKPVGSTTIHVEEFVPERLRVSGNFEKTSFISSEEAKLDFSAEYLFGGNASGAGFEVSCDLEPALFNPKNNSDFTYAVWSPDDKTPGSIPLGVESGKLDNDGKGSVKCPAPKNNARFAGMTNLVTKAAVFEAGSGRTTMKTFRVPVHPEKFYLGLRTSSTKLKSGDKALVKGILTDSEGNIIPENREIDVQIFSVRVEHNWSYNRSTGDYNYNRRIHPEISEKMKIKSKGGKFEISFTADRIAPLYMVRVQSGIARTDLQIEGSGSGYAWDYWESGSDKTPGPMQATWLDVKTPEEIRVGQKAKAKVVFPYRGYALFAVETDSILTHEWVEVEEAGTFEWEFKVKDFQPNIYVSALLVKDPHQESKASYLPERAYGVRPVRITPEDYLAELQINAPKSVFPRDKLSVNLKLKGGDRESFVTLAAVDEGILQLTGFESPDPLGTIMTQRALGVETFETVGWNFLFPSQPDTSKTGGDTGMGNGTAAAPRPVKPVALWSGIVPFDKNGNATVKFDVPSFRGELRLMAVAAGKNRIAIASDKVKVTEPLVILPTTPRFLSRGDEIEIPVFVSNTTEANLKVDLSIAATQFDTGNGDAGFEGGISSPVTITSNKSTTLDIPRSGSATALFRLRADQAYGGVKLKFTVESGPIFSMDEAEIPLTNSNRKYRDDRTIQVSSSSIELPYPSYEKGTDKTTVVITTNPYSRAVATHLPRLLHYPYGCIEQTTSTVRPLIYLPELVSNLDPALAKTEKIRDWVNAGIARILGMQTASGGFAYWPGGDEPNAYGSLIATQVLIDAQKAGYQVPDERVRMAIRYLGQRLNNQLVYREPKYAANWSWYGWDDEPYIHFLMATQGNAHKARIEKLLESGVYFGFESLYMLKAALYLTGDKRFESDLRYPEIRIDLSKRWGYYSDLRALGFVMNIHTDLFPDDPSSHRLAAQLADHLTKGSDWFSTQELTWGVTALGKLTNGKSLSSIEPSLSLKKGKAFSKLAISGGKEWQWRLRNPQSKPIQLAINKGPLPENAFLVVNAEGVPNPPRETSEHSGIVMTHEYLTVSGEPVDLTKPIRLGEIVIAKITLENVTDNAEIRDIALTDRLPAGFEIENPRIGRGKALDGWLYKDDLWNSEYTDIRDDRINIFGSLSKGKEVVVVTALRATAAGTFRSGGTEASAMYNQNLFARIPGKLITISRDAK